MIFLPFRALRPAPEYAAEIAAPPYDVVSREEARRLAEGNPRSFLRISRPDLEFPDTVAPTDPAIYRRAAERLRQFMDERWLRRDKEPSFFFYRLQAATHTQWGIVGTCDVTDYENRTIRRHERTRAEPEEDRTRHTAAIDANAGPVWLFWEDEEGWADSWRGVESDAPLYDMVRPDGVRHTIWRVSDVDPMTEHFSRVKKSYIADGHHRAAAAARVAAMRRAANPRHNGTEEYNRFLAVLFPADGLRIAPYNRLVRDLGSLSKKGFLDAVSASFEIRRAQGPWPSAPGRIAMYLGKNWSELSRPPEPAADPVARLDVSVLQEHLLAPILGIRDPRQDARLMCVGGAQSAQELARRVDAGEGAVAFSLRPVSVRQLMAVADADLTMPPKSTWFEPKLLSGLLIHPLDSAIAR